MTPALAIQSSPLADPLEALTAIADARAYLWSRCEFLDLLDAVDGVQELAERWGLVDAIGNDAVMQVISGAFQPYRGLLPC